MTPELEPSGDAAWRVRLQGDGGNRRGLRAALREVPGVVDAVVSEQHALVTFDPDRPPSLDRLRDAIASGLARPEGETPPRAHRVRVRYDGADLDDLSRATGLGRAELVAAHGAPTYVVVTLGFQPGFAYLRGLDPRLMAPRRATPRPRVPAGSVAIAGPYAGVYPFESPGGWHLLGTAVDFAPFDAARGAAFEVGDRVRFESEAPSSEGATSEGATTTSEDATTTSEGATSEGATSSAPAAVATTGDGAAAAGGRGASAGPALEVVRVAGLSAVQDAGRPGFMHQGVPPGGALVGEWLARANAAVDNAPGEAGVEVFGAATFVARGRTIVATDDGVRRVVDDGESIAVACEGARVRYLAVRGGIDVPRVLGGRGTLLGARLGGHHGRALARGDVLAVGASHAAPAPSTKAPLAVDAAPALSSKARTAFDVDASTALDAEAPIHVRRGPDTEADVFERLLAAALAVDARSDRVGVRLRGLALPAGHPALRPGRASDVSSPMVRGTIQLPPDGVPIVLGPDHPTTGGYPVIAVVARRDQGRLGALPVGHRVRFVTES